MARFVKQGLTDRDFLGSRRLSQGSQAGLVEWIREPELQTMWLLHDEIQVLPTLLAALLRVTSL